MARPSVLLVLALLVAPVLAVLPTAEACGAAGVPCGRIYPQIQMRVPDQQPAYDVAQGVPLELEAELTFRFDMANEGYTVPSPNDPIVVRFEFPRKPKWVEMAVEPESIAVPVHDPTYAQADPAASPPQAHFVYTTTIKITALVTGQAVLRDGYDYQKLLVFAKSTESGLYQAGYGIKEIRIAPEGALHESDLAGTRDVFTPSPLPALALQPVEASFGGVTATLTPPSGGAFWEPLPFEIAVQPAFRGRMVVALHDEQGGLLAQSPPLDASSGRALLNATLVRPGLHTATVTLLPEAGEPVPPVTLPLDFVAGDLAAEGWEFPKTYVQSVSEPVPVPTGNSADPLAQFERDVPFFAFDSAQSVTIGVGLRTPMLDAAGRSLANLQFSVLDPEGNLLAQKSVDPTKPYDSLRVGSLPADGWYAVRLAGAGVPAGSAYDVSIEGVYAQPVLQRNRADGVADATGGLLGLGGRNVTIPADALQVWQPGDLTPQVEGTSGARYALTVTGANGTLAYATGQRQGPATFSAPAPGAYRAFAYVEPVAPATAFSPLVRAFTFAVGNATSTTAQVFTVEDLVDVSLAGPTPSVLALHALPAVGLAGEVTIVAEGVRTRLVTAEGEEASADAAGVEPLFLEVSASRADAGPASTGGVTMDLAFPAYVDLVGPDVAPTSAPPATAPIPFLAVGALLAVAGAAAVTVALARRK